MTGWKTLIPKPLKRAVRNLRGHVNDSKELRLYRERCDRGEDLWVEPVVTCSKARLGRGDGEWFARPDGLGPGSIVYSVGVGDNISFDLDLIDRFGVEVHAFDPTPISRKWLEAQELPANFHFHPIGVADRDGVAEFLLPAAHGVSFTMMDAPTGGRLTSCEVARLGTILERLGHRHVDLLKLDIEGAEYDVIGDIVEHNDRIGQLLIEFHHRMIGGEGALAKTKDALEKLADAGFKLFHVSSRGLEYSFVRDRARHASITRS